MGVGLSVELRRGNCWDAVYPFIFLIEETEVRMTIKVQYKL